MCVPPSGRKYGFPKAMPEALKENKSEETFTEWLVSEGYPREETTNTVLNYCRFWIEVESFEEIT
jgi:hypothetical protein